MRNLFPFLRRRSLGRRNDHWCIFLFFAFAMHPAWAHSTQSLSISAKVLHSISGEYHKFDYSGVGWPNGYYANVFSILVKNLKDRDITTQIDKKFDDADIQVVFVDIPATYVHESASVKSNGNELALKIYPDNLENKNIADDLTGKDLNSPLVKAKLFYSGEQLVGGIIVLPMSPLVRAKQLLYASRGEWQSFLTVPTVTVNEVAVDSAFYSSVDALYTEKIRNSERPHPTNEELEAVFGPLGQNAVVIAHLTSMGIYAPCFGGNSDDVIYKCFQQSEPFYNEMYERTFSKLFSAERTSLDAGYNIPFSPGEVKAIADSNAGYNCFLKK